MSPVSPCRPAAALRGRAQVLVVEDDAVLGALVADALRLDGIGAAVARSGSEALRLAGEVRPACVLLDLHLPDMDGAAFVDVYRAHGGAAVPIVLCTGVEAATATRETKRLGAAGLLAKPFDLDALAALVSRYACPAPS